MTPNNFLRKQSVLLQEGKGRQRYKTENKDFYDGF